MVAYLCSAYNQSNIFKRYNNFHLFSVGLWKSSRAATRKNAAAFLLTAVPRHRLSLAIIAKCLTHYEPDTPPQDLRNKVVRQLGSQFYPFEGRSEEKKELATHLAECTPRAAVSCR